MELDYRISLWNYIHYANAPALEEAVRQIRDLGFGAELWDSWRDERELFHPEQRTRLRRMAEGMNVSMHTMMHKGGKPLSMGENRMQIETAAFIGADTIVVHVSTLNLGSEAPDYGFVKDIVGFATDRGVTLALENGDIHAIEKALAHVDGLRACLDTGHVYNDGFTMDECLRVMGDRLAHLHVQDKLSQRDHYTPGTGIIPEEDWALLFSALKEMDFNGGAVFEIAPRRPDVTAQEAAAFLDGLIS